MRTFTHLVDVGGAPGHIPSGLRAQQGVNTHIQGPTCAQHTTPETVAPKTQTTSPATPHFQHISPKWSVFWALHHPKPQPRRHQPGGNYAIQASDTPTTRRKKASHGAKPPIATSVEGTEEHRTRMLRPRWRQGMARLRDDAPISDPAPLVWRAPEGPEGTGGLRGAAPNEVRPPSLAGGRALRRPEHPWGHKQRHAARTASGRAAAHRHTQRPGPQSTRGARNTRGATQPHSTTTTAPTTKRGRDRFPGRGLAALNQRYSAEQAPAIRRSCPRGPRPRRGQPRGGQRGRGTGSRTRSRRPRCGRSGSTAGRHRARHTRRA